MKGKGLLIAMLGKGKGGGMNEEEGPSSSKMESDGPSPEKVKMFRKMRKAFESGDDESGAMAFEALASMCGDDYEDE
ncbi:MAG: hypothetical protein EBR82_14890 [Caulobacteraceae bacterium]|nr:hypothetical protein [Caulobacteraceae bacterium]